MKPRVFIGSSSERKELALAVQENLGQDAEVTVWAQDVFKPTDYILESLLAEIERSDFGIFVLAPDDFAQVREQPVRIARDNVLFELGLFIGRLGRDHCFILSPQTNNFHLPSDIAGITAVEFPASPPHKLISAIAPACNKIRRAIRERKGRLSPSAKEVISHILAVAARLLALRAGLNENEVRGFCHVFDEERGCLTPVAMYMGVRVHEDANVDIPCSGKTATDDWYVISRTFRSNRYHCAEVDWSLEIDNIPYARQIWGDLNSVVAYPIKPPEKGATPIGTIAFDSSRKLDDLKWKDDRDLRDILALLSSSIYTVLSQIR